MTPSLRPMFRRLFLDHATAWFTVVAFVTAVTVFASMVWHALRLPRARLSRLAQLPFQSDTPSSARDESRS